MYGRLFLSFSFSGFKATPRGPLGPPEMGRPKLWPPGRHPVGVSGKDRKPNRNSALVLSLSGPALLLPIRTLPSRIRALVLTVYAPVLCVTALGTRWLQREDIWS